MSIFGSIVSAIFGSAKAAGSAVADAVTGGAAKPQPMTREQVEAQIQKVADSTGRKGYNWKQSIVDLMKLLDIDFEPEREETARTRTGLYRRPRRIGGDEYLAAQAGHGEDDGKRRRSPSQFEVSKATRAFVRCSLDERLANLLLRAFLPGARGSFFAARNATQWLVAHRTIYRSVWSDCDLLYDLP